MTPDEQRKDAIRSAPTLDEVRALLSELHYCADGGGPLESADCLEAERVLRWLLNEYLRRGTHVTNGLDATEADRVA